jgi:predicted hotdog family 3-hydroxylacyl-ACP dehydratase
MSVLSLPLAAVELVPHRKPMLLIERLLEVAGKSGLVEAQIGPDFLFLDGNNQVEAVAYVELIAQGYAALKGYIDRQQGLKVRQGFLVGVKTCVVHRPAHLGDRLAIDLKTIAEVGDFAIAEGVIRCEEAVLAHAEIKIWIQ